MRCEKAEKRRMIQDLKICYILNPTRAVENYIDTEGDVCWLKTELPGGKEEIKMLLGSRELEGYIFQHPKSASLVQMCDWVSCTLLPTSAWLTSYTTNPGIHWVFFPPGGQIHCQV